MASQREHGIAWTQETWNPIRGCTRVSEGCRNCYAEKVAHRFSGPGQPYEGLVNAQGRWNGTVRLVEDKLTEPLTWRKPRRVFVNSMSDLFHEAVSDETIDRIFAVMALAPQHTFQVLTKRPDRMQAYMGARHRVQSIQFTGEKLKPSRPPQHWYHVSDWSCRMTPWPLKHVWLGVSVEDQATADARIPLLLQTPAAVRFISAEPLLGPVEFSDVTNRADAVEQWGKKALSGIDWVIVGGESGPGARPCALEWIESIVGQCGDAGVPVFVKQLGAYVVSEERTDEDGGWAWRMGTKDRKGGDPAEWSVDLRVRQFPGGVA